MIFSIGVGILGVSIFCLGFFGDAIQRHSKAKAIAFDMGKSQPDTKEEIDRRIARLKSIMSRPEFRFQNTANLAVRGLERQLWDIKHPRIAFIRKTLSNVLLCLSGKLRDLAYRIA
jgi:hypothetical protein